MISAILALINFISKILFTIIIFSLMPIIWLMVSAFFTGVYVLMGCLIVFAGISLFLGVLYVSLRTIWRAEQKIVTA